MMLEQVLNYIHNFFVKEVYRGNFTISEGSLSVDFLQVGQYFKITGSVFNDGVYEYPATNLKDENFKGEIWALAIPPALIALSIEIEDWQKKYGEASDSPFQSESFGGYSYSKGSASGAGAGISGGWQNVFGTRLNAYRKIS